ncbi:hypothetical protein B0A48_17998 [Cryoendolithus antarcticus]|uniref:BTB domain-containing protein n=1 Tax=Cryoendolithus antarcticus TaxID=1507870 RepID=A0A1V8SAI1_9PEZI|nr:hypothetical protein B0A48_17998 [Cryoendolithus antarcticus]
MKRNDQEAIEPAKLEAAVQHDRITVISAGGDLVLHIRHSTVDSTAHAHAFRVSTTVLRRQSKYFDRLLDPVKFGEGQRVATAHEQLHTQYQDLTKTIVDELPVVYVEDLGRIPTVKSIEPVCLDFLNILHGKEVQSTLPAANLATLAIVADRFDALEAVQIYARRKKLMAGIDSRTLPKMELALGEGRVRQRLLVALMLDHCPWIERYSLRMMAQGWTGREAAVADPLWWDLPGRVEEELSLRRSYVLETIQSVQEHFLSVYSTRKRVCRLGYDSSPECDSFQLGEIVRFFLRAGTLKMQGAITNTEDSEIVPYAGDLALLFDKLKQVPEYQVNAHHSHCGIRTQYVPFLQLVEAALPHAALCGICWVEDRHNHSWLDSKRPLRWSQGTSELDLRSTDHRRRHVGLRDFFMATQRDWLV